MTTVAWDGVVLAADRQTTAGGTATPTRKIFKATAPDGTRWLYGCSGSAAEAQEFTRRLEAGIPMPTFKDLSILAINEHLEVFQGREDMFWERKNTTKWAMGSGCDYALGAMYAGKDAIDAVGIAAKLDVTTGLGVDALRFT